MLAQLSAASRHDATGRKSPKLAQWAEALGILRMPVHPSVSRDAERPLEKNALFGFRDQTMSREKVFHLLEKSSLSSARLSRLLHSRTHSTKASWNKYAFAMSFPFQGEWNSRFSLPGENFCRRQIMRKRYRNIKTCIRPKEEAKTAKRFFLSAYGQIRKNLERVQPLFRLGLTFGLREWPYKARHGQSLYSFQRVFLTLVSCVETGVGPTNIEYD